MWEDILFLGAAGFLVGSFLYTGWYTTHYEPATRPGYIIVGIGIVTAAIQNVWLEFHVNGSSWFLVLELISFAIIAAGLTFIVRARRKARKEVI